MVETLRQHEMEDNSSSTVVTERKGGNNKLFLVSLKRSLIMCSGKRTRDISAISEEWRKGPSDASDCGRRSLLMSRLMCIGNDWIGKCNVHGITLVKRKK